MNKQVLQKRLKEIGMSQAELARRFHSNRSLVNDWIHSDCHLSYKRLCEVADMLDLLVNDLMDSPDIENYLGNITREELEFYKSYNEALMDYEDDEPIEDYGVDLVELFNEIYDEEKN